MKSYEQEVKKLIEEGKPLPDKLDISMLKYFWLANPFLSEKEDSIPKFLRKIVVLKNFSDYELMILSKYLHKRKFSAGEKVFRQTDSGVGFYFVFTGHVDIIVEADSYTSSQEPESPATRHIITLEKRDYFGELALLQDNSLRNATVIARDNCQLLGIFKPDVEELISTYPIVAAKLLQSVSIIITNRLFSLTNEVKNLKGKIRQLEKENGELESK